MPIICPAKIPAFFPPSNATVATGTPPGICKIDKIESQPSIEFLDFIDLLAHPERFGGDVKDAFLKAAELDPNHIDTRWALVELYIQLPGIIGGSKSKSFKYANELEALSKVDGYLAKGYIYEYDNEPENAEKYYK